MILMKYFPTFTLQTTKVFTASEAAAELRRNGLVGTQKKYLDILAQDNSCLSIMATQKS